LRLLQQALVHRDRLADLALLAIQVSEDHVHFERVVFEVRGAAQLLDRQVDLVGDEKIQSEDVVRRLPRAAAVDPAAVLQLVALPGLADREAGEERDERREHRGVAAHACDSRVSARYVSRSGSHFCCARRISSISSRAAPCPPPARAIQCTRARTSSAPSAGAAAKPARRSTGRASTASPTYPAAPTGGRRPART